MENLLQNFASGLWIVLGVYCFFGLRKWNKRFSELYDELKGEVERWPVTGTTIGATKSNRMMVSGIPALMISTIGGSGENS